MSMTGEEILAAMQTIVDKAQAATDQKLTAIQAAIDKKIVTTQKETIDILHEEMQNITEVAANKAVQRVQTTTLTHIVADHSVRIKKLEEAELKKSINFLT